MTDLEADLLIARVEIERLQAQLAEYDALAASQRRERAAMEYRANKTIENADRFVDAVYGVKHKNEQSEVDK